MTKDLYVEYSEGAWPKSDAKWYVKERVKKKDTEGDLVSSHTLTRGGPFDTEEEAQAALKVLSPNA